MKSTRLDGLIVLKKMVENEFALNVAPVLNYSFLIFQKGSVFIAKSRHYRDV
jgi:hypothetical protein